MWWASKHILTMTACLALCAGSCRVIAQSDSAASGAAISEQDRVSEYLDRMHLQSLLLDHLTSRMKSAGADDRLKLAERLGRVYAQLLSEAKDPAVREDLINRSEELLKSVPQAKAFELRVNLLRQRYTVAEELSERWRLKLGDDVSRAEAERVFRVIRPQLDQLVAELKKREDSLQQGLDNDAGIGEKLEIELGQVRRWKSTALYYSGWSGYYLSLVSGQAAGLHEARLAFGAIIHGGSGSAGGGTEPAIEKLNKDYLKYDHVARAAAGVALCEGLQNRDVIGMLWLDALRDATQTPPGVREQLLRWRITVLSGAKRWADLDREVRLSRPGPDPLPAATARLLAVATLDAQGGGSDAQLVPLSKLAVADLIARKELSSVVDIAKRYGTASLGREGFVTFYVQGVQTYQDVVDGAKALGANVDEPLQDVVAINRLGDAARLLNDGAKQQDASEFPKERAHALMVAGRALFLAGRLRDAGEQFAKASESAREAADTAASQEALWLAIVSLEKAEKSENGATEKLAIEERSEQLTALFIKQYPGTDRAAQLTLRQLSRSDRVDEEAIRVLQSVSKESPVYESSRRQLARLLYRVYRSSAASDRAFASARYIKVADEVLACDTKAALEAKGDDVKPASERAIGTARQILDAVLGVPSPDVSRAEKVLGTIKKIVYTNESQFKSIADELMFREIQICVAKGDLAQADTLAEKLQSRFDSARQGTEEFASARRFTIAARRSLLQHAEASMRAAVSEEKKLMAAERVLRHGIPVVDDLGSAAGVMNDPAVIGVYGRVAEAGAIIWRSKRDASARDTALRLDRLVLASKPTVIECLTRQAELSEAAGDMTTAIGAWRQLANGTPPDSELWTRSKYEFFRLLKSTDEATAKSALQQHLLLHPKGLDPWHAKMQQLAEELGVTLTSSGDGSGGSKP